MRERLHELVLGHLKDIDGACDEMDKEMYELRNLAYEQRQLNDLLKKYCKKNKIELVINSYNNKVDWRATLGIKK